jgi:hypothetical protein
MSFAPCWYRGHNVPNGDRFCTREPQASESMQKQYALLRNDGSGSWIEAGRR